MESTNLTKEKLKELFSKDKRFDDRNLTQLRELEVSFEVSNKAEGSAKIKLGKTEVIAGVKMSLGSPYPDSPDKGNLIVSGDLLPLASPKFESGPPKFNAIELPRLVDRAIRESGMIDFKKLCVTPGEKVWTVFVDVYPINDDGNLIDAATLAATLAIKKAVIPGITQSGSPDYKNRTSNSILASDEVLPIPFTFFKLGDFLILDPTREEEEACEVRITWGASLWKGQIMLNSCQKSGLTPLSASEVENMMSIISSKFKELNEKLKNFL
jgi:exosome complex component RRP42